MWVLIVLELSSRGQRAGNPELSLVEKAHPTSISRVKSVCPWVPYTIMALHKSGWLELKDVMLKIKHTSHTSISGLLHYLPVGSAYRTLHTAAPHRKVSFKGLTSC